MERTGIDIITDGEMRRESYSNRFATALEGVDIDTPAKVINRAGSETVVPRVVGKIRRRHPVEVRDARFLRANTDRLTKMTVPGPFTMAQQCQDDFYGDEETLALDYAAAVNEEIRDLFAAGIDIVQIDEPWMQARPERARRYGIRALDRALDGIQGTTAVHICFGYAAMVKEKPTGYSFLAELEQSSAVASAGQPVLVLLGGDSGVGKTRLIGELERLLSERGVLVLHGDAVEQSEAELPYAPLTSALRPLVRSRAPALEELSRGSRTQLAALFPGLDETGSAAPVDDPSSQLRLFEALVELLDCLSSSAPVTLILDAP